MEVKLSANNEITKTFEVISDVSGELSIFVSKAFDEDSDAHFLVISIPELPKLKVLKIQFPIKFDNEKDRDAAFDTELNEKWVESILTQIEDSIINNNKAAMEKSNDSPIDN